VNWIARVNRNLPAGTYTVLDSDPRTWSRNPQSGGQGFTIVRGAAFNLRGPIAINPRPPVAAPPPVQNCNVSPVYIRGLRYNDYSRFVSVATPNVGLGGFIRISTRCLPFNGQLVVTLQDTARGNGFGVTAFRLTNVRIQGSTVVAQVPNLAIFRNRSFHVAVFVYGSPWSHANAGTVSIR